eukprot:766279-Ditylum_brightwellii.AAC.1
MVDKVSYKDLNTFINTNVTAALNKAMTSQKKKRKKEVELNTLNKFCSFKVERSNEEDELNKHAPAADNDNDSSISCLLSNDSNSNIST